MQADIEPTPVWTRDLLWAEHDARHERELRHHGIGLAILLSIVWTFAPIATYALYEVAHALTYDGGIPAMTHRDGPCAPVPGVAP